MVGRNLQLQRSCVRSGINPRRISRPEILDRGGKKAVFGGINRVDQDSRQGLGHEISVEFPGWCSAYRTFWQGIRLPPGHENPRPLLPPVREIDPVL